MSDPIVLGGIFLLAALVALNLRGGREYTRRLQLATQHAKEVLDQYAVAVGTNCDMWCLDNSVRVCLNLPGDIDDDDLAQTLGRLVRFACLCPWSNLVCTHHYVWPDQRCAERWEMIGYYPVWRTLKAVCIGDQGWKSGDPPEVMIGFDTELNPTFLAKRIHEGRDPASGSKGKPEGYNYTVVWGTKMKDGHRLVAPPNQY